MGTPYVGEIRMVGFNFAPVGWAVCDGQLLSISENEVLFNLIGTTYGGDGETTFAVPDLRGRLPMHQSSGYTLGQGGGAEQVTLTLNQIPVHSHPARANSGSGNASGPSNAVWARDETLPLYTDQAPTVNMSAQAVAPTGGSQPHDNMMPYTVINFVISLFGVYPSPT